MADLQGQPAPAPATAPQPRGEQALPACPGEHVRVRRLCGGVPVQPRQTGRAPPSSWARWGSWRAGRTRSGRPQPWAATPFRTWPVSTADFNEGKEATGDSLRADLIRHEAFKKEFTFVERLQESAAMIANYPARGLSLLKGFQGVIYQNWRRGTSFWAACGGGGAAVGPVCAV
ncbi:uncharacterized protein LOC120643840 isoform X2 [Panicum virgatum]|uniref:uncharacterized protein LOC120643840 isoform X2 n=1 Tax=Panicum virgatum TaxID=38727 RepID=UPI0019D5F7F1|nr:uncharacterized protein LOC120643840 isoform X2 [Panicum virgatum]